MPQPESSQTIKAEGGSSVSGVIQGKEVIGNILVTGDHNQIFTGSYDRLRDAYIKPWSVFERVHLNRFYGRGWLRDKVESFLAKNESGYFVLEAKAGLGKTAFLAHLVQELSCIHHFVELAPGSDGIAAGLKSLAAQLILAWKLSPQGADQVLPGAATRPEFLQNLLFEAAEQRDRNKPGEKILVVVDALDEAGVPSGQNVLGLPRTLPKGVYFVVSQRPVAVPLTTFSYRQVFSLQADDENNMEDTRGYLQGATTWKGVSSALKESNHTSQAFVDALFKKSNGVWIYLHYVVTDIERGERLPQDLTSLPNGVWQYYAQYWLNWRKRDNWDSVLLPLLSGLAAVQEDVTLELLSGLTGVAENPDIRRLLKETWYPFLVIADEPERKYRLYHASLREFFDGRADLTELTEQEQTLTEELAKGTHQAHGRICDFYFRTWGGIDNHLPKIQNLTGEDLTARYGLKHLAAHLEAANRTDELHQLLRVERVHEESQEITRKGWRGFLDRLVGHKATVIRRRFENVWYVEQERAGDVSGYLADIERAWVIARGDDSHGADLNKPRPRKKTAEGNQSISLQARYALIEASINSLAQNIPPALLKYLVEQKRWTVTQALVYARQTPDAQQKAEALIQIIPLLPPSLKDESVRIALTTIQSIKGSEEQMQLLRKLAPQLSEEFLRQSLNTKWGEWHGVKLMTLDALAPHLPVSILKELLDEFDKNDDVQFRVQMLAKVLPFCPESLRSETARRSYLELKQLRGPYGSASHSVFEAALAPYLPEPLASEAFNIVLAEDRLLRNNLLQASGTAEILGKFVSHLPADQLEKVLPQLFYQVRTTGFPQNRVAAFAALAPHVTSSLLIPLATEFFNSLTEINDDERDYHIRRRLPEIAKFGYADAALSFVKEIKREHTKAEALAGIAPFLTEGAVLYALTLLNEIKNEWSRNQALSPLLVRLAELGRVEEALAKVATIKTNRWKLAALTGVLPFLVDPLRDSVLRQALETAKAARDDYGDQERVIASLVAALAGTGAHEKAIELARTAEPKWIRARVLAQLVSALPKQIRNQVQTETIREIRQRDPYNQAILLAELSPVLPPAAAKKAIKWALSAAEPIEDQFLKLEAFIRVIPLLPDELIEDAIQKALSALNSVDDESKKARALTTFAPYLSDKELSEGWAKGNTIRGLFTRERVLAAIVPYLSRSFIEQIPAGIKTPQQQYERHAEIEAVILRLAEDGEVERALSVARELENQLIRMQALASLAKYLTKEDVQQLVEEVKAVSDRMARARVLSRLVPYVAKDERNVIVEMAIDAAEAGYDEELKAYILATLLPYVPDNAKAKTLKRIILSFQGMSRERRSAVYAILTPCLLELPASDRRSIWNEVLQDFASKVRGDLFSDLAVFMPVISDLGGAKELVNLNNAIQDVVNWWG